MNQDLRKKIIYVSKDERIAISELLSKMAFYTTEFSKIAHSTECFRFTEFSMLYQDLYYFFNTDILTRNNVTLSDLKSFSNSFYSLYRKLETLFSNNESPLRLFLFSGYQLFNNWFNISLKACDLEISTPPIGLS